MMQMFPDYLEIERSAISRKPASFRSCMRSRSEREIIEKYPWIAANLFAAFEEARAQEHEARAQQHFIAAFCRSRGARVSPSVCSNCQRELLPYGIECQSQDASSLSCNTASSRACCTQSGCSRSLFRRRCIEASGVDSLPRRRDARLATCSSSCDCTPDAPIAPTHSPWWRSGNPPWNIAPAGRFANAGLFLDAVLPDLVGRASAPR